MKITWGIKPVSGLLKICGTILLIVGFNTANTFIFGLGFIMATQIELGF